MFLLELVKILLKMSELFTSRSVLLYVFDRQLMCSMRTGYSIFLVLYQVKLDSVKDKSGYLENNMIAQIG